MTLIARLVLVGWCAVTGEARAHDPYEITTRAFVHSNHLELRIEMEFQAAMLLAGDTAGRGDPAGATNRFERALPRLRELAAEFLHFTAAGIPLAGISTNITLGVENHVDCELKFSLPDSRALRFEVGALQELSRHGPYGTSLTVMDMVRQQVIGQSVLFGDSQAVEMESGTDSQPLTSNPPVVVRLHSTSPNQVPSGVEVREEVSSRAWYWFASAGALIGFLIVMIRRKRSLQN